MSSVPRTIILTYILLPIFTNRMRESEMCVCVCVNFYLEAAHRNKNMQKRFTFYMFYFPTTFWANFVNKNNLETKHKTNKTHATHIWTAA